MLKWFSKKKDEDKKEGGPQKSKSERHLSLHENSQSMNLKIKKKMNLPVNFAKRVIDMEL